MSSGNDQLRQTAIEQFIEQPCVYGTDVVHGGLFYFVDADGHSPVQLEWPMKLWWVHCEAMLALLMAFQSSRQQKHWELFLKLFQYCFAKVYIAAVAAAGCCGVCCIVCVYPSLQFSDPSNGEWFGYLTREGIVNQTFKGGPYKGMAERECVLLCNGCNYRVLPRATELAVLCDGAAETAGVMVLQKLQEESCH